MLEKVRAQARSYANAYLEPDIDSLISYIPSSMIEKNGGRDSIYSRYSKWFSNNKGKERIRIDFELNNFVKIYEGSLIEEDTKFYCPFIIKWVWLNRTDTVEVYSIVTAISKDIYGDRWYFPYSETIAEDNISESFPDINFKPVKREKGFSWIIQEGSPIPDFEVKLLNGSIITNKDLMGSPTLINFYYPGCVPCLRSLEFIENEILSEHNPDDLNVLTIGWYSWKDKVQKRNYDEVKEAIERRLPFFDEKFNDNIGIDVNLEIMGKFNTKVVPYTVLVDKDGVVSYSCISNSSLLEDEFQDINGLIRQLGVSESAPIECIVEKELVLKAVESDFELDYDRNSRKAYKQAAKDFEVLAQKGNAQAQVCLGFLYEKGYGVMSDPGKALKLYRSAAGAGNVLAQYKLGCMYETGEGVDKDYSIAAQWYRKSAEQGYPRAQFNLGNLYYYGNGVGKDYATAFYWYKKSAEQGYPSAQCDLGYMYFNGIGVALDYDAALKWYRKSAEQGDARAQCNLGYMYAKGKGVTKDIDVALKWYRKSAEQGNETAKKNYDSLLSSVVDEIFLYLWDH